MNEAITEESVLLYGDDGQLRAVSLADAVALARPRSLDLVEEWEPPRPPPRGRAVVCQLMRVAHPLVWEGAAEPPEPAGDPELDPDLWFETTHCEGRHYILGAGHTFTGRIWAWCRREGLPRRPGAAPANPASSCRRGHAAPDPGPSPADQSR